MRSWDSYPNRYRSHEVAIVCRWITSGVSGAVVGAPGSGKSNLLGFICHRPDALRPTIPAGETIFIIPLDLNNLPAEDLSTFYRALLRAFYEARVRFDEDLRQPLVALFRSHYAAGDPFVAQSALREWLLTLQRRRHRVILVIDRFDWFCLHAPPALADTLRGLRDSFKDTLSYIVGTRREMGYFADREALGELYELLDTFVCWMQPMAEQDAHRLIRQEAGRRQPDDEQARHLLALSGRHPALLKSACHWWRLQTELLPPAAWAEALVRFPAAAHRLETLWQSFTLSEQQALQRVCGVQASPAGVQARQALARLEAQGIVYRDGREWRIRGRMLARHVHATTPASPGGLRLDEKSDTIFQGGVPVAALAPLESALLRYLLQHPYTRHTHTALIEAAWPEDTLRDGVSTEALYQVVRGLRRKIEPAPSKPRYVVNWRGTPEGGYRCFPEGRPG